MKRIAVLVASVAGVLGVSAGVASALVVPTPVGSVTVNDGLWLVNGDGADSNPAPGGGWVGVSSGGQVCSDDNGHPTDNNPNNDPDSASPMCVP